MTTQKTTSKTGLTKPKLIQLIHIAKSQLHLDEDTYRAMLTAQTGKNSTKNMTLTELRTVFEHLKTVGFKTTPAKGTNLKRETNMANDDQSKLIRHLWLSLHDLGEVKNPSEQALAKYVERQTGISALQWLNIPQASTVIESLKKWEMRILKPRAVAFLTAINEQRINRFLFSPELLNWIHQLAKGKLTAIDADSYATFTQAYQTLTKSQQPIS